LGDRCPGGGIVTRTAPRLSCLLVCLTTAAARAPSRHTSSDVDALCCVPYGSPGCPSCRGQFSQARARWKSTHRSIPYPDIPGSLIPHVPVPCNCFAPRHLIRLALHVCASFMNVANASACACPPLRPVRTTTTHGWI
jgi:hypothetical protein